MVLAADGWPGWRTLLWVTLAMAGARTLAMAVNRLADRLIDAANPPPLLRPARGPPRAAVLPRADHRGLRAAGLDDGARLPPLARGRGGGRIAGLRALARLAGRSLAARRGVLQRQRLHRSDPLPLGDRGPPGVSEALGGVDKGRFVSAMFSPIPRRYALLNSLITFGLHHPS